MKRRSFAFGACLLPLAVPPAHALTVTSATHPVHVFYDFSTDAVPFQPYAMPGGVPSGARFDVRDGVLHITNAFGGSFGVDTKIAPFDAAQFGDVFFDYKLSPQVKVNIFFRVKGAYHSAIFSGPPSVRPGGVLLGQIADVQADEKWHRAHIPLRDWLRRLYPLDEQLKVDEIIIGNWDNDNFLMAGVGGNGPDASWDLDDFAIVDSGPREAKLQIAAENADLANYRWTLDGQNAALLPPAATFSVAADDGLHFVQIKDESGREAASYPLLMAAAPPRIGAARLEENGVAVPVEAVAGLQTRDVKLKLGGREFDLSSSFLSWDGAAGVLRLDAGEAGFAWKDGERVPVTLSVRDRQNRTASRDDAVTLEFSQHRSAPPLPRLIIGETAAQNDTFETGLDGWETRGKDGAILDCDTATAASGAASLRLTCPSNGAMFGAWIRRDGFDAAQFPIVSFHYKIPARLRTDFQVSYDGKIYAVGFTDGPQANRKIKPPPRIGKIDGVLADNEWHRAEFNLLEMLRKLKPDADSYKIEGLALGDGGWPGNYQGAQFWMDDFQLAPQINGELQARVELHDITGLQAISWVLDETPQTEATRTANGQSTLSATGAGRRWLHLRAQNGAGEWSETVHFPVLFGAATGN